MKKRVLGILLTLCIMLYHMPITAPATEIKSKLPTLTVNQSKVAFAGHEWWVIGDGTSGVYPQSGHITLLSANADSDFKNVIFVTDKILNPKDIRNTLNTAGRIIMPIIRTEAHGQLQMSIWEVLCSRRWSRSQTEFRLKNRLSSAQGV